MTAETKSNDLDAGQYTSDSIRKYEAIYGRDFVSPGGGTTALAILSLVEITPDMRVLDVGCGLGGAAFLMAQRFGARVHGIDLSWNMLEIAGSRCRQADLTRVVTFEHANIVQYDPRAAYDLVHSRDVFLHIHEKARLFAVLMRCLRPGGHVLFSDYLCGEGAPSRDFAAYIGERNYDLCSLAAYRTQLARAGFAVVLAEDRTAEFIAILERELDQLQASWLPAHERDELAQSWQAKLRRARAGEQRWGVFVGRRNEE